jgi:hypothetical protein
LSYETARRKKIDIVRKVQHDIANASNNNVRKTGQWKFAGVNEMKLTAFSGN